MSFSILAANKKTSIMASENGLFVTTDGLIFKAKELKQVRDNIFPKLIIFPSLPTIVQ